MEARLMHSVLPTLPIGLLHGHIGGTFTAGLHSGENDLVSSHLTQDRFHFRENNLEERVLNVQRDSIGWMNCEATGQLHGLQYQN